MIRNILWYTICQMYKKKWATLITTIMLGIGFAVMYYAMLIYAFFHYQEIQAKKLLSYDIEDTFFIRHSTIYSSLSNEELENIIGFIEEVDDLDGIDAHGMFYVMENYEADTQEFFISENLTSLCELNNIYDEKVSFVSGDKEYGYAAVGYNLSDDYPIGSIYVSSDGTKKYIITDILKKGTEWIPERNGDSVIKLDNMIMLDLDYNSTVSLDILNGLESWYFVSDDKTTRQEILRLANEYDVELYGVYNVKDRYEKYSELSMDSYGEMYFFPFFIYVAAVVSIIISTMTVIYTEHIDLGIFLANGFSKIELMIIMILQGVIKCLFATLVSVMIWLINLKKMAGAFAVLAIELMPIYVLLSLLTIVFVSIIPVCYIKNKKNVELLKK